MSLTPDEIAARYAFSRPGLRLIGFQEVGLPHYWLTLDAIVQERKPLTPIDEFVLLAARSGLTRPQDVAGFLGLDEGLVKRSIVGHINADSLDWASVAPGGRALTLTERGAQVAAELATIEPKQTPLYVAFDRLTWQVTQLRREDLLRPRDLRDEGLRELSWKTARHPTPSEIPLRAVDRALIARGFQRPEDEEIRSDILMITGVSRAERMYRRAVLLVYQDESAMENDAAAVDLIVDGRPSEAHVAAFSALDQAKSIRLEAGEDVSVVPEALHERVKAVTKQATELEEAAAKARERLHEVESGIDAEASAGEVEAAKAELRGAEQQLADLPVRPVHVWDHPPILREALATVRTRLLIISPWIKNAVVDREFLDRLTGCLERGARVHIAYGITRNPNERNPSDAVAVAALAGLSARYDKFTFCRLGDTHAKVLVADDFVVTTSFNWLSYQGDPNRTFRQEEGVLVHIPTYVDEEYASHAKRIDDACAAETD